MKKRKIHCAYCGGLLSRKMEGETEREYCTECEVFFYENPLPVASSIVIKDRQILLVKRKYNPKSGYWCLPMGFAESGESIEDAALRELEEEAGIKGKIIDQVNIESGVSETYGDLLFITFEVEWTGGEMKAGDDAEDVELFSFKDLPELAFSSNTNAVKKYLVEKEEYWAIMDSFSKVIAKDRDAEPQVDFLSAKLIRVIEKNIEIISGYWLDDVRSNHTTPTYAKFNLEESFKRNKLVIRQFREWLEGKFTNHELHLYYQKIGKKRKAEGFSMSEVLSAIMLTRKHLWEFALTHGMWDRTLDIYMTLELERNMMLFFDRVSYHVALGFEG